MSVLRAENLRRVFGEHVALEDFSLEVEPSSIVGLIGPSGGGKTTAIRLCCGLDRPDRGTVRLFDRPVSKLRRQDRQRISLLAQTPALVEEMTIEQQVSFSARLYGLRTDGITSALDRVGLSESANTRISAASGGMRRRTGLAAALITDPELVFCDEPTAGLDPILRERIWRWFRTRRSHGSAMVVTTQHIEEAARCDRVIILREGIVIADAKPAQLAVSSGLAEQVVIGVPYFELDRSLAALAVRFEGEAWASGCDIVLGAADAASAAADASRTLRNIGVSISSIDTVAPGLDDVFRAIVEARE